MNVSSKHVVNERDATMPPRELDSGDNFTDTAHQLISTRQMARRVRESRDINSYKFETFNIE